jgi:hypothetical protein
MIKLGAGDAPYHSNRSLLRVIHDNLLSGNLPVGKRPANPPPIPPNKPEPPARKPVPTQPPREEPPKSPPKGVQPWDATKFYASGSLVSYNGKVYICTLAHQAQVDWTPSAAVSLWSETIAR